ncbi:hypothetical protein BS78_K251800 [Paspalum vaginatum]|uniref:Transposase (putative) gypsy type domain-containing protein n=1 Tax=Paspalum vaginatum TaxID=158149 RepID=A0A9W7X7E3_9POAL|nr:hypothetical protein BS78_K251800 [Paspalum vaginatum]
MGSGHQSFWETDENLTRVRRLLGWTDAEHCDNVRTGSLPHRNLQPGEFVLFVPYLYCGLGILISSFFMLLLEAFGLQLQHLTPHSILHAAIFAHLCEMFVGVPPCVMLFRHFFSVRCSRRSSTEIGRYYFLLKGSGGRSTYLPTFASAKWEHWRNDWVIVRAEPNDRLALPDSSPDASLPEWGASTDLPPEFSPVLARIAELINGRLTSMHVLADFLRQRLTPLQMRPRSAWSYTGPNDCSRVVRGEDHDLTPLLLEEWVRCVTDEGFSPEQLRLPSAIVPLCRDQALRTAVLREMPTLDDGGLAARQLGGDPNRGSTSATSRLGVREPEALPLSTKARGRWQRPPIFSGGRRGDVAKAGSRQRDLCLGARPEAPADLGGRKLFWASSNTAAPGPAAAAATGTTSDAGPAAAGSNGTAGLGSAAAATTGTAGHGPAATAGFWPSWPLDGAHPEALDDAQEAFRLEWAWLQRERERLDSGQARLGERIEAATAQHARAHAELSTARIELDADRAAYHKDLQRLVNQEHAVGVREKRVEVGEAQLKLDRAKLESTQKGVEQRRLELVEVSERQAAVNTELDKMRSRLAEHEAAVAAREGTVAQREAAAKALKESSACQAATLKIREDWVKSREAELTGQEKQLLVERAALEQLKQDAAQQAVAEDREQMCAGLQRIADWAGEASSALVPLGLSPSQVTEPPSTIADALPVLDSAVEQLRRLDSTLGERLETEGRELCRAVAEHLLVCFRSHDPAISVDPVFAGPVEEAEAAARESVQEVVEVVAARFQRAPADEEPDAPRAGAPPAP